MTLQLPLKPKNPLIVGIGSALVDLLLQESDSFVEASPGKKGGMTLVDHTVIENLLAKSKNKPSVVSGGSAGNTIVGVGRLGGPARFIGKLGSDALGKKFEEDMKRNGVDPVLSRAPSATGRVLSVITPDAQRTMFTYLGASSEMKPSEVSAAKIGDAAIVHIEGYLLFNHDLALACLKAAKAAGALVSLDLASFTVVEANKAVLPDMIRDYVDILIANEDEARAYTGLNDEAKALQQMQKEAPLAVVKIGRRGSVIGYNNRVAKIGIMGDGNATDTTGAGDLWAAGFLYGIAHGLTIEKAGRLGAACGFEVCQVVGAHIPDDGWERISRYAS
jgi:sugar/nucleoside kinase (ribokinase family)